MQKTQTDPEKEASGDRTASHPECPPPTTTTSNGRLRSTAATGGGGGGALRCTGHGSWEEVTVNASVDEAR